jgi:membrane-bound lytic murein transglycosylase D
MTRIFMVRGLSRAACGAAADYGTEPPHRRPGGCRALPGDGLLQGSAAGLTGDGLGDSIRRCYSQVAHMYDKKSALLFLVAALGSLNAPLLQAADPDVAEPARIAVQQAIASPDLVTVAPAETDLGLSELPRPAVPTLDLTAEPADLWERIRNGFAMPDLMSPLVMQHQAGYLNRPQNLVRVIQRSRRYLHHIVEEIEKRGMPTELALLPIVESAFNPMALSRARASGLWQFIPSTGRVYQLRQNWWIDERRDIVASTAAALDYLQTIYEMHGDWHLALASYNWGEGAVARAIEKNEARGLPTDYSSLSMPAETRNYVPKLQALKNIVARPQLFGLELESIPNRPYFATVEKPGDMDLALAARLAETPLDEFRALNPGYNRPIASGQARLAVPADKVETFLSNLESHDKPLVSWRSYALRKGEKIEAVAARFDISAAKLRHLNGLAPRAKLVPGQTLLVPATREALLVSEPMLDDLPSPEATYEATADNRTASRVKVRIAKGGKSTKVAAKRGVKPVVAKVGGKPPGKKVAGTKRPSPGKTAAVASQGPRKVASRRVRSKA